MGNGAPSRLGRRNLLKGALSLGGASILAGCAGPLDRSVNRAYLNLRPGPTGRVVIAEDNVLSPDALMREAVAEVSDLAWLGRGDSVFIKVASNSYYPHPSVTYPPSVVAMVNLLRERGAGEIIVGDQAGVEHVRLTKAGRKSSTREIMQRNGLAAAVGRSGASLHCFDDQGWEGYYEATSDFDHHWEAPMHLPKIVKEVDHIVLLPRISSHALAGYTCAIKAAVGWLRDDSRRTLHQKGASFFQKLAEINHLPDLRQRVRLVVTLGSHARANIGPDVGGSYAFDGHMVIASESLADHDAVASALIPWLDRHNASIWDLYNPYPTDVDYWNHGFVAQTWGAAAADRGYQAIRPFPLERHVATDPCISHLAYLQGRRIDRLDLVTMRRSLPEGLREYLARYDGRPFRFDAPVAG